MLERSKRRGWLAGRAVRHARGAAIAPTQDRELLEAVWEALNVARDNKALAIVRQGTIANINSLAAQLCERSSCELIGKRVAEFLDGCRLPDLAPMRVGRQL